MSVSSYLEIFLTQFGWLMYDRIWDVILSTGLSYLPFISLFAKHIGAPLKSQEARDAAATSLNRIEIDLLAMFTVVVVCVQPLLTIEYTGLSFTRACGDGSTVTAGTTGTTYDRTFTQAALGGEQAIIPVWWYAVLAVSGGFNDAVVLAIPCSTNIRLVTTKIENSRIKDPRLRHQVQLFYNDCWLEAKMRFLDHNLEYSNDLPVDDFYWIGSQYFVNGLYKDIRASAQIPGFTYDSNRDLEYNPKVYIPQYGKPTCQQWWTGQGHESGIGLREALSKQIKQDWMTEFEQAVTTLAGATPEEVQNIAVRSLISREETHFNGLRDLNMYNDYSLANMGNSVAGMAGSIIESMSFYPAMYMMKAAAPIIQSVVLMLIYMLMPLYFWFSSYDIGKIVFMSIIVFSIKFWTVLWAVANWLDNNLIAALEPSWYRIDLNQNNMLVELIIGFVIAGMFVVVPLFWSGVLTWAGFRVGSQLSTFIDKASDTPGDAGKKGGKAGLDMAKNLMKK